MSHSVVSLFAEQFDTRAALGGCLININGETHECSLDRDDTYAASPTYTVRETRTRESLCTFRPYHLHGGPVMYHIEGVSLAGGDAALIVPLLDGDRDAPSEGEG